MANKRPKVLVVDDDPGIRKLVEYNLGMEGYEVIAAGGGKEGLSRAKSESPDLVLLDLMMPDMHGFKVCQELKSDSRMSIILLTAVNGEEDVLKGFSVGADDYVTKPFSSEELLARVRAVLRRSRFPEEMPRPSVEYGNLTLDFEGRRVLVNGNEVPLTATEHRVMTLLFINVGRVLTHDYLLDKVWGDKYKGKAHLLQVAMSRLRTKLVEAGCNKDVIQTRVGIGYVVPKLD